MDRESIQRGHANIDCHDLNVYSLPEKCANRNRKIEYEMLKHLVLWKLQISIAVSLSVTKWLNLIVWREGSLCDVGRQYRKYRNFVRLMEEKTM